MLAVLEQLLLLAYFRGEIMAWTLLSYSEIVMPLFPYSAGYVIVLVENEEKVRMIAHVYKRYLNKLSLGMKGSLEEIEQARGKINLFSPE